MKKKMNYIKITEFGDASKLKLYQKHLPLINDHEVLIKVYASGVNRPDVLQRLGMYMPPKGASDIPGLEVSGKVVNIGKKVKSIKINQKICALTHGGGYAQYCKAHWKHVLPMPKGLTYVEAAAIPETFFTVRYNLFDIGKLKNHETVLIHGGSSGIGTTAIQLAKHIGANVIVTVGSRVKVRACKELGADLVINYKEKDFLNEVKNFTSNAGVDVILDMVGQKYFSNNLSLLKDKGRLVVIAFLSGNIANIDLQKILKKRIIITGSTLRPRSDIEKGKIARDVFKIYWKEFSKKTIKPIIYKTFALQDASEAHKLMESSKHIGKIVLI